MKSPPHSQQFDDFYFSPQDGLAETRHVFLDGNNLPNAWHGQKNFTIAETGFGTGLNFLAVADLFSRTSEPNQKLHYISIEKYPLTPEYIKENLEHWNLPHLAPLLQNYPIRIGGSHPVCVNQNIHLTLVFGDANEVLPDLEFLADCWFLDGFKPSSNPDMWTNIVFQNMARLTKNGGTFATFTAAGFVKRGLQSAGFTVEKTKGFGRKREMLIGVKS